MIFERLSIAYQRTPQHVRLTLLLPRFYFSARNFKTQVVMPPNPNLLQESEITESILLKELIHNQRADMTFQKQPESR